MEPKEYPKINMLQIHYFLKVAEKGSFTSAAKQLYTTQSTLSKTIISIEQTLGLTLFIRSHKRLILTDAGKHLYKKWKQVLEDFDHSVEECRILQSGYQSMLSIGMLDSHDPEKFALPQIRNFMRHKSEHSQQSCRGNPIRSTDRTSGSGLYGIVRCGTAADGGTGLLRDQYLSS